MEEKIMHLANFNITFGEKEEPMLMHFEKIIYPAFMSGIKRGKEGEYPVFSISDVEIKKCENNEYVLVGNYIKDTEYQIRTKMENGTLVSAPGQVPTAPYSRFIVFLKNHRMILVRNEQASPDIRSFQATVRLVLNRYTRNANKQKKDELEKTEKLPYAIVNIVDIPQKEDIQEVLKGVAKIDWVKLRFFPLNNDLDQQPLTNHFRNEMKKMGANTANASFNSPESKQGVQEFIEDATKSGLVATTMHVIDNDGEEKTIKEDSFSSNRKIAFATDLTSGDDEFLISIAKKDSVINDVSQENQSLYERVIGSIVKKLTV